MNKVYLLTELEVARLEDAARIGSTLINQVEDEGAKNNLRILVKLIHSITRPDGRAPQIAPSQ